MPFTMVKGFLMSVLLLAVYSNASVLDQPVDKSKGYEEAGSENIVQDFDKGLKVTKVVESNGEQKCLLEILDETTRSTNVKKSIEGKPENTIHQSKSVNLTIHVSDNLVEDRSFLSETAAALCVDAPIYLTYKSSDESADVEPARRSKRQAGPCCNDQRLEKYGYTYIRYETSGCVKYCYWRNRNGYQIQTTLRYYRGLQFDECGDWDYVCKQCGGNRWCNRYDVHGN